EDTGSAGNSASAPCAAANAGRCSRRCSCGSASRSCWAATSLAGRTQQGNNNAYCQDNAINWFDWAAAALDLLARPGGCLGGGVGAETWELGWYMPAGTTMTQADGAEPNVRSLAIYLDGADDPDRAAGGRCWSRRFPGPGQRLVGAARLHDSGDAPRSRPGTRKSTRSTGRDPTCGGSKSAVASRPPVRAGASPPPRAPALTR